ncbi:lipoprotein [Mesoplasma tabanidae]|uniref:Uncharacterized protein n=1 Tax=Mesoplasma tabanidae TaxID=219745 RepID=A0A2K8P6D5_9MOLU|nr:lipoprotein [Mesoplasma tabanidae]ATZ21680.1 hypothetical protein MTABA_v1c04820 [Mesoplasma tabanidae]
MKKLLSIIGALGLSATTAPVLFNSTNTLNTDTNEKTNVEFGTNSLGSFYNTNQLRKVFNTETFNGKGTETSTSNYSVESLSASWISTLIYRKDVNIINLEGNFLVDTSIRTDSFDSILLKRKDIDNNEKATFEGSIIKKDNNGDLIWSIDLETIYYVNEATNKGYVDVKLTNTAFDAYKNDNGVNFVFKAQQENWYINNNISTSQELGNEMLLPISNLTASNSLVVIGKNRETKESTSGLTGNKVDNSLYNLQRTKRISFYGKMRYSISQPNYRYHVMVDSVEFIKNETLSTANELFFETNYQTIYDIPGVETINATLQLTMKISIDPVTNIATFSNKGLIDLDNTSSSVSNSWMEITYAFNKGAIWA